MSRERDQREVPKRRAPTSDRLKSVKSFNISLTISRLPLNRNGSERQTDNCNLKLFPAEFFMSFVIQLRKADPWVSHQRTYTAQCTKEPPVTEQKL